MITVTVRGQAYDVTDARRLADELSAAVAEVSVPDSRALAAIEQGISMQELATVAGVDLDALSAYDAAALGVALSRWPASVAEHPAQGARGRLNRSTRQRQSRPRIRVRGRFRCSA